MNVAAGDLHSSRKGYVERMLVQLAIPTSATPGIAAFYSKAWNATSLTHQLATLVWLPISLNHIQPYEALFKPYKTL